MYLPDDYNDYDEVTIPPNLTDLLAHLPDDLSADSLQRMFRDQVLSSKDRKNLLETFEFLKNEMKVRSIFVLNFFLKISEEKAWITENDERITSWRSSYG